LDDAGYVGQFASTLAGMYTVSVYAKGSHIEGSPFANVRINPAPASGITSTVERYDSVGTAGAAMTAILRIKDAFGNLRQDISDAPFINMNGAGTSSFAFQSTYAVTFVSRVAFVGLLTANMAGSVLFDTRLAVTVHPGDANSCLFIFSSFSSCCCWARLILACAGVERARQTEGRFHLPSLVQSQLFTLLSPCFVLIVFVQDAYSR
jgi:hypothetical protein